MKKIGFIIGLFFLPIIIIMFSISASTESDTTTDFTPRTEQEKVAYQVLQYVEKNGGTKEFACAWIGNMEHESGLIPSRIQSDLPYMEATAMNPSLGGYAMGLAQWDSGRRVNLLNYAKEKKKEWKDIDLQLDYAWNHDGSDSNLLKKYSKGTDINQITVDILKYWERAGTKDDPMQQAQRKTSANNWYKRLSTGSQGAGSANVGGGKIDVLETQMGKKVYNGQCYGLTSFYVDNFNTGIHLGAGSPVGISGNVGNTVNAWEIGSAYSWESNGWQVINNPSYSDVKAGDIINWGQGGGATTSYGHTGIVASVSGNNKYTTYEQNAGQGEICAKYERTWGVEFPNTTSIVRKK
ncbi:phage tail tip lysozyme [Enterococcus termitis]|uniref:Amidase n=1 Tax=Enterococcus termitis TaxID=332950 RepID=A0A1E5GVS0_9ENTE|nr:phage tail tip lysozyme [Enterococcus termitis]OEG16782.1 amidase [Enterococcus termitis]OJG99491.1 CHAP domain protein [Enterococcus termitis]